MVKRQGWSVRGKEFTTLFSDMSWAGRTRSGETRKTREETFSPSGKTSAIAG